MCAHFTIPNKYGIIIVRFAHNIRDLLMLNTVKVTFNVVGKLRFVQVNGRDFAIAPIRILMPKVLSGSKGALYYPPDEIAKNIYHWNGKPMVVYHPMRNGVQVPVASPDIFEKQEIGRVFNSEIDKDHGLRVEGWFDVELTKRIDMRVWNSLITGEKLEVSTGLFTDDEKAADNSECDGIPYEHIARNFRPDHLAILPDEIGACSCSDGCGVFNSKPDGFSKDELLIVGNWYAENFSATPTNNPGWVGDESIWEQAKEKAKEEGHTDDYEYIAGIYKKLGGSVISQTSNKGGNAMYKKDVIVGLLVTNCDCYKNNQNESKTKLTALSDAALKEIILENGETLVGNAAKETDNGDGAFFEWMMNADTDIRSAFVKMMKRKITSQTGETGKGNAFPAKTDPPAATDEEKKKAEEEAMRKKKEEELAAASATNSNKGQQMTRDQVLALLLPEDREALTTAKEITDNEKNRMVTQLTAHITDNNKKQTMVTNLLKKSVPALRELIELMPQPANNNQNNNSGGVDYVTALFSGAQGNSGGNITDNSDRYKNEILDVPEHDWAK